MSKYLDFIGQQISQSKSAEGSQNEDLEFSEESGVMANVKKHGLKVAGSLVAVAGGVFAYKHFTKSKPEETAMIQETISTTEEINEDMPIIGDVNEDMPIIGEEDIADISTIEETPIIEETIEEVSTAPASNLEDLFGVQFSPSKEEMTMTVEEEDDMAGSAAMNLPGADLFSGASLTNPAMLPQIEGKFE